MGRSSRFLACVLVSALALGNAAPATACAFHGYTPDPTLVDVLLATEQVVTARLSPSNPRQLVPYQTLLGPEVTEISLPSGRETRARLQAHPAARVLLARDGAYGPWMEVAILDDRFGLIIDRVLARQSDWLYGGDRERLALFAGLVNDPNPDIRRLALQELDRAPYNDLKGLRRPQVQNLRQDLEIGDKDLMPIRVLLAGLSQDRSFRPALAAGLDNAVRDEVPYMGAYATALIELEGQSAVRDIVDRYLKPGAIPETTRERLVEALALQYRSASAATRKLIAQEVAMLSRASPAFAQTAARQFGVQSRWRPATASQQMGPAPSRGPGR